MNQLIRANKNGNVVEYSYDPLGRRIERHVILNEDLRDEYIERFVYSGHNVIEKIISNVDGSVRDHKRYITGLGIDQVFGEISNDSVKYYIRDYLGNIKAVIDGEGNLVNLRRYRAFGEELLEPESGFGYTSREYDDVTGLYYYRSRFYDPQLGRFIQRDKFNEAGYVTNNPEVIFNPKQINDYAYVGNNPINYVDPWGWERKYKIKIESDEFDYYAHANPFLNTITLTGLYLSQPEIVKQSFLIHEETHLGQGSFGYGFRSVLLKITSLIGIKYYPKEEKEAYQKQLQFIYSALEDKSVTDKQKEELYEHLYMDIKDTLEKEYGVDYKIPSKFDQYKPNYPIFQKKCE